MTLPLLSGSALNDASWASPTDSKVNPTSHSSAPTITTGSTVDARTIAASTGRDDDEHDAGLRQVDLAQHGGGHRARRVVVAEHLRVARVLALPVVAPADVDRQAQAPDRHEREHDGAHHGVADAEHARGHVRDHGDDHEAQAPRHVDDAVPPGQARDDQRRREHHDDAGHRGREQEAEGGQVEGRSHEPGVPASERARNDQSSRVAGMPLRPRSVGRARRIWSTPMRFSSNASAPPAR